MILTNQFLCPFQSFSLSRSNDIHIKNCLNHLNLFKHSQRFSIRSRFRSSTSSKFLFLISAFARSPCSSPLRFASLVYWYCKLSFTMSNSPITISKNYNVASFETFFDVWLVRQAHILDELLLAQQHWDESQDDEIKDLITRVLAQYQQYYEEKSKMARRNVFLLFSPPWLSSFEHTFLWIAGFKPSLAFRLVNESVNGLTEEQVRRIKILTEDTRIEEKILNDKLAKIQESVAAPPIMELARGQGRLLDGEIKVDRGAMGWLQPSMETVVVSADLLRITTVAKVVEILNPLQNVKFLTAATQLQLMTRSLGLQRDRERKDSK